VLLWLLAAGVVGVVGSLLLEGARVAAPIRLAPALVMIVPVEWACYLLALGAGVPRLSGGKTVLGVGLGLVLRGGLAAVLGTLAPSPLAPGGVEQGWLFYYARLWPAALVQILAVTAFLWLIRDLLLTRRAPEEAAALPPPEEGEARQQQLLRALLEPAEPRAVPPLPMGMGEGDLEPPRRARFRPARLLGRGRRPAPAPQSPLLAAEPPPAPPRQEIDTALALPRQPSPDDTAALPLVRGRSVPPGEPESSLPGSEE
jgi:hypothetical protein